MIRPHRKHSRIGVSSQETTWATFFIAMDFFKMVATSVILRVRVCIWYSCHIDVQRVLQCRSNTRLSFVHL